MQVLLFKQMVLLFSVCHGVRELQLKWNSRTRSTAVNHAIKKV